jgi:predicted house-cleaning noncanonical NTP pyrophosphatase (MazG superfamily)
MSQPTERELTRYDKLVRDKIPARIEAKGERCAWYTAADGEFREKLLAKLQEEAAEFVADPSREELADVMEVIEALRELYGWTAEEVAALQAEKREARGGYRDRIVLEWS